jgi:hypothetical protein
MILRIVRGRVEDDRLAALTAGFTGPFREIARNTPGLVRFHAATRAIPGEARHDLVVVTFWATVDAALSAFDGDLAAVRTLDGIGTHAELRDVAYFEIDESQLRRSETEPAFLRLTLGRMTRGIDAEIQQELRRRMHELGPEMTEAYVGRRIIGTDVEIAFISAWAAEPDSNPLDAPFWPDISERYDAFEVGTYVPLVSGMPAT